MRATRTFPSSRRAWPFALAPFELRFFAICSSMSKLLADVQDALQDGDPGGGGEQVDRPREQPPWGKYEAGGDHDDALGAGAQSDVAAQPERLRLGPCIRDEEGAGDRED